MIIQAFNRQIQEQLNKPKGGTDKDKIKAFLPYAQGTTDKIGKILRVVK